MREIRFRAWDKDESKMLYHDIMHVDIHGDDAFVKVGFNEPVPDFELMQYTGLKDKNGKEIYEGDIVKELLAAGLFAVGISAGEDIDMWCRLACQGPFFYNARLSSTYNDAHSPTWAGGEREVTPPIFAQRFPKLTREGRVPPALVDSGRRYANFLFLEYARQLLDCGQFVEARAVLLNHCNVRYDSNRFIKRLLRTWPPGRALFQLSRVALGALHS